MKYIKIILNKINDGTIKETFEEIKWIFSYTKKYKLEIIFYIFLGIFSSIMSLISSIASKELINIVTGIQKNKALEMVVLMVSMSLFSLFFTQIMSRITLKINIKIKNEIQSDIFNKILNVNWFDLTKYHSGDLLNRFTNDIEIISQSAIGWIPNLIINLFNFIATLLLIMYYDPVMMLLALVNAPIMFFSSNILMKRMRKYNKKVKEMNSTMMEFQTETFNNIDSIKAFDLIGSFNNKLEIIQQKNKEVNLEYNLFNINMNLILSLIGMFVGFSYYGWAVYRLWSGTITYGEMTLFLHQSSRITTIFSSLVGIVPSTINSTISASRIMEIIKLPKENIDKNEIDILNDGFSIELENVSFSYVENKKILVSNNMDINAGEIIGLIGPSGEGKTTLIRMFLGLIVPTDGHVVLKHKNGEIFNLDASTRHLFAYVPQGNTIFSGTIADNLRMIKENATDEEIIQALKDACAWEFVNELEDGIYSKVGSFGKGLSEGQAQRIGIARALIKNAEILLLDEATSALDSNTEKQILKNISLSHPNKVIILATHRTNVLSICDKVYQIMNTKLDLLKDTMIDKERDIYD